MKDIVSVIAFIFIVIAFCIVGYKSAKPHEICDKTVILHDGTTIPACETTSYLNHLTYIVTCDGDKIKIPTENIKMIK